MVLFTNNRKLGRFKKPIIFGTKLQSKNLVKYLGVTLDEKLNWNSHIHHRMQKTSHAFWQCRRVIGTETKSCVLDIHFGGKTHFDLRVLNKCQSKNSTPATPCLCKHNRNHGGKSGDLQTESFWQIYSIKAFKS
jgi:hypothetical protein